MSFKVEIEIEPYDDEWCNGCKGLDDEYCHCYIFDRLIEPVNNIYAYTRCPECLEAEKKYKEKENA